MEFFEKAFAWLAEVSQKLPKVDTNLFFIVVLAVIAGLGVVIAFTLLGSRARKLFLSSRKIRKYLANVDAVDDDNVSDFTAHCFSKKTPQALRDAWVQYLGVRFGYPSDIVSDSAVYDKFVKKNKDVRSGIFLGVSLVLLGLFSFWGYGILSAPEMGTVHLAALVLIGALYLVLVILCRKQNQRCLETFDAMQEDLDAKVNLQIESNYATDSSPLQELNSLVEEIIARNTAKAVDIDDENEQTPIEALIEQKMLEQNELDEVEQQEDDEDSSAQTEEQVLEPVVEEETQDEQDEQASDEQIGINDILQEQEASDEEQNAEDADAQSEQEGNESLEEVPVEDEDIDEEALDETPVEEDTQVEDTTDDENLEEGTESVQEESPEEDNQDDNQIEQEPQADNVIEEAPQDEQEYFQAQEDNDESDEQIEEQQEEVEGEQNVEDENREQSDFEAEEESAESEETAEENPQTDESDDNVEREQSEEVAEEEEEKPENPEEVASEQESNEEENSDEDENSDDEEENSKDEEIDGEEESEDSETEEEPEVVYVVDGDEDEEEHVKPAKLVKLPNLVDYMLSKNMPKAMKIQIATMLIGTYNKFKDSKEDRKIVIQCLTKVMRDLQNNK